MELDKKAVTIQCLAHFVFMDLCLSVTKKINSTAEVAADCCREITLHGQADI
jgi:hypothetical protein